MRIKLAVGRLICVHRYHYKFVGLESVGVDRATLSSCFIITVILHYQLCFPSYHHRCLQLSSLSSNIIIMVILCFFTFIYNHHHFHCTFHPVTENQKHSSFFHSIFLNLSSQWRSSRTSCELLSLMYLKTKNIPNHGGVMGRPETMCPRTNVLGPLGPSMNLRGNKISLH